MRHTSHARVVTRLRDALDRRSLTRTPRTTTPPTHPTLSAMPAAMSTVLSLILLALPLSIMAAPVLDTALSSPEPFQPLAVVFSLLPFPLLAALKYAYLRFRRGQSIHAAHATSSVPTSPVPTSPVLASASPALSLRSRSLSPSSFSLALHPYLVGIFGSPDWETTISCRIHHTLRRAKPPSPPLSPLLADSTRTTRTNRSTTTAYPTISTKSRATSHSSRSKYLSVSLVDKSRVRLPNDFAVMQPPSPPLVQLPPPAHLPNTSVRFSVQQSSPTLMQIMEPVLSSWYDDSPKLRPPVVLLNNKSISPSNSVSSQSQDRSTSTGDTCEFLFILQAHLLTPPSSSVPHPAHFSSFPWYLLVSLHSCHALRSASAAAYPLGFLLCAHHQCGHSTFTGLRLYRCLPLACSSQYSGSPACLHAIYPTRKLRRSPSRLATGERERQRLRLPTESHPS